MNSKFYGVCECCGYEGILVYATKNNMFDKRLCKKCFSEHKKDNTKKRKYKNRIDILESYAEIIFYDLKGEVKYRCKIDLEEVEKVGKYKWYILTNSKTKTKYVATKDKHCKELFLHRLINETPKNMYTDHISGDVHDNRKFNLRNATPMQNSWNNEKFLGVKKYTSKNRGDRYRAYITINGVWTHLGMFDNYEEAMAVRKEKEIEQRGEFSPLICRAEEL